MQTVQHKKQNKIPLVSMFLSNSGGLSSKRILGILGFLICCIIFICGFTFSKEIPEYGDILLITSASLCGLDSVTGIWKKSVNK